MTPTQTERVNFWWPILAAALTIALSAGIAYGVIGSDVRQNKRDLAGIRDREMASGSTITDILVAQGRLETEIGALTARVDTVARIMEREYGRLSSGASGP